MSKPLMTATGLIDHAKSVFAKCATVMEKKNADYSASDNNAFRNFEAVEQFGIVDTKSGMMVRLTDKFTRICNLLKKDADAVEESLQDSIEDAINYLVILHARLEGEKKAKRDIPGSKGEGGR